MKTKETYRDALHKIKSYKIEEVSQKLIIDSICEFGLVFDNRDIYGDYKKYMNSNGELGLWQRPIQLSECILYLLKNCSKINSFLEIGTHKALTFLIFREFLFLQNPDLESLTIDPIKFVSDDFLKFFSINYQNTRASSIEKNYDLIFIDGDHAYNSVKKDFELALKLNPKYILFHDIVDKNCPGVVRFWSEIKKDFKNYHEFTDSNDLMGLGLIVLT
jgi:hypothetical protein